MLHWKAECSVDRCCLNTESSQSSWSSHNNSQTVIKFLGDPAVKSLYNLSFIVPPCSFMMCLILAITECMDVVDWCRDECPGTPICHLL